MTVRCYSEDEFGAFWEKWVAQLGPTWERPMRDQWKAMFPHRCGAPWMTVAPEWGLLNGWLIITDAQCWQKDDAHLVWCQR